MMPGFPVGLYYVITTDIAEAAVLVHLNRTLTVLEGSFDESLNDAIYENSTEKLVFGFVKKVVLR